MWALRDITTGERGLGGGSKAGKSEVVVDKVEGEQGWKNKKVGGKEKGR